MLMALGFFLRALQAENTVKQNCQMSDVKTASALSSTRT